MNFYFCETCGKRITDHELAEGQGRDKKLKGVYCKTCSAGVLTLETLPLTDSAARELLGQPAPGRTPPVNARIPNATPRAPSHVRPAAPPAPTAPFFPAAGLVVAAVLGVGLLLWLVSSRPAARPAQANPLAAPRAVPPPPASGARKASVPATTEGGSPTPTPIATRPAPEFPAATPEPAPSGAEKAAQEEFEILARFEGLEAQDLEGRRARLTEFVNRRGETLAASRARRLLVELGKSAAVPAALSVKRAPPPAAPTAAVAPSADPREAEEQRRAANREKSLEVLDAFRKELAPLLAGGRFTAALDLLETRRADQALACAADEFKQEKEDLQALLALRQAAVEALRKRAGQSLTLKKAGGALTGQVVERPEASGVTLKLQGGSEVSVDAEFLDATDVAAAAPKGEGPALAEDLRRRGLLFLAAGDVVRAKGYFLAARDAGCAAAPYLERIEALELGETEMRARKAFDAAEKLFAAQKWKEAQAAYTAFCAEYARSKVLVKREAALKERLASIESILSPLLPGLAALYCKEREFKEENILLRRVDANVDFNWGGGAPAPEVPSNHFCARWTGVLKIAKAGHYTFATLADDGARLWINGKPVIDDWLGHGKPGPQRTTGSVDLPEGQADVRLEYYENRVDATCRFLWTLQDGFQETVLPPDVLFHQPPPPASGAEAKK